MHNVEQLIEDGKESEVLELLVNGSISQNEYNRTLFCAANKKSKSVFKWLVNAGADVNYVGDHGFSILHVVGDIELANMCLSKGANLEVLNENGYTPLTVAIMCNRPEMVTFLLDHGADTDNHDADGTGACRWACTLGHADLLRLLISHGADINVSNNQGRGLLHETEGIYATREAMSKYPEYVIRTQRKFDSRLEIARILIEGNIDIEITDKSNHTAFDDICRNRDVDMLQMLVSMTNGMDDDGHMIISLLSSVVKYGDLDLVKSFMSSRVNEFPGNESMKLDDIVTSYGHRDIVKEILAHRDRILDQAQQDDCFLRNLEKYAYKDNDILELLTSLDAKRGSATLHMACEHDDFEHVRRLIQEGADVNAVNNVGETALHLECQGDAADIIRVLVKAGAKVDIVDDNGYTPLRHAVIECSVETIRFLLEHGANPQLDDALVRAIERGNRHIVNMLINSGADVHSQANENAIIEQLYDAVILGDVAKVKMITELGIDVTQRIEGIMYSETIMHQAVGRGNESIVGMLVDCGAPVNDSSRFGDSLLYVAMIGGHIGVATRLLTAGADPNLVDIHGQTPVMGALQAKNDQALVLLSRHGADMNGVPPMYETYLQNECKLLHWENAKALIRVGADVNMIGTYDRRSPLELAINGRNAEVICELLRTGTTISDDSLILLQGMAKAHHELRGLLEGRQRADEQKAGNTHHESKPDNDPHVMMRDKEGRTHLHLAAHKGDVSSVISLLSRGAEIDAQDNGGRTALHYASVKGHKECVEVLVNYGAGVSVTDNEGRTPLYWAMRNAHTETVVFLLSKGSG